MATVRCSRKAVTDFAKLMEERLRDNDHKGGWANDTPSSLLARIFEEWLELRDALKVVTPWGRRQDYCRKAVCCECADVANFAMMIADNLSNRDD